MRENMKKDLENKNTRITSLEEYKEEKQNVSMSRFRSQLSAWQTQSGSHVKFTEMMKKSCELKASGFLDEAQALEKEAIKFGYDNGLFPRPKPHLAPEDKT
jgi:hypothetical protein